MNYLLITLALLFGDITFADDQSDELYRPEDHGYSEKETKKEIKKRAKSIDTYKIAEDIAKSFEAQDQFASAQYTDEAIENIVEGTIALLKQYGHTKEADDIEIEYMLKHRYSITKSLANKEMGDHAPLSKWLLAVHDKAHELLGDFICRMTRIHDLWTLSYALPVMFNPSKYDQKEFLDHWTGHRFIGFIWVHRGGLPLITFWIINGTCGALTSGLGWITFICGPISGLGQTMSENYFSDPIGEFVWKKANGQ